jgi:hypothetical protein
VTAELHRHDLGLTWVVQEPLMRTSHALAADGRVWLIDPVDEPAALAAAAALGEPAGVIQLLDRHNRDCRAVAERWDVPRLRVPDAVPGSPFEVVPSGVRVPRWDEVSLWWPERRALIVAEVLGTSPHYTLDSGPVGIHAVLRLAPPGRLRGYAAEHLLPGHGRPIHGPDTADEIDAAYARSRRDLPKLLLKAPRMARAAKQATSR